MAFDRNGSAPGSTNANDEKWKAAGFVNIYLPQPDGTRRKVGAIALKKANVFEAAVAKRLAEGGEAVLEAFANAIEISFNVAEAKPVDEKAGIGF
jgi:hypothetical protein